MVRFVDDPGGAAFDEDGLPVDLQDAAHAGLPLLAVTDLGWYGGPRLRQAWLRLGRQLRRAGERIHALVPVPMARWTPPLARVWSPMPWERPAPGEPASTEHEARASRLLDLAAPARRLEPGLLRALRLLLPREAADVGTEADAWMHDDIVSMCAGATALRSDRVPARLERLGADPGLRARVEALLHEWHWCRGRRPELWHMEVLALAGGGPVRAGAVARAQDFLANLGRRAMRLSHGSGHDRQIEAMQRWLDHLKRHAPATVWSRDSTAGRGLQIAWWATHAGDEPPHDADPMLAAAVRGERPGSLRRYTWRQSGEALEALPRPTRPGSLVASLWASSPGVYPVGPGVDPGPVAVTSAARIVALPTSPLELRADRSTLIIQPLALPAWASAIGRDPAGLWAEMTIDRVEYRLRWIPPGRFLMGSPATEQGRWDNEGPQHEVVVSRGYWLGETPVTQALWQAVMDENPSHFKDPERPVETVSWNDVQGFLELLNAEPESMDEDEVVREADDSERFRLPSEAEWEYACRAGTTTATYAGEGEAVLGAIAWWSGNSGGQTHPVRQRQPNAWGLHDMLGNVLEWCSDCMRPYSSEVAADPVGPVQVDYRVIRGGCWDYDARRLRAPSRYAFPPDSCNKGLGFRLARGQGTRQEGQPPTGRKRRDEYTEKPRGMTALEARFSNFFYLNEEQREGTDER